MIFRLYYIKVIDLYKPYQQYVPDHLLAIFQDVNSYLSHSFLNPRQKSSITKSVRQ